MNEMLIPLSFEGREIRVVTICGEPFFVGRDVAERLGCADPAGAIAKHCKGSPKRHPLSTPGGEHRMSAFCQSPMCCG